MWIIVMLGVVCAMYLRSQYEREQLSVERTAVTTEKVKEKCTMVFLSDLHDHEFGIENERLLAEIDAVSPDMVVIGGDTMVVKENADTAVALDLIGKLARQYPVYCGNGNHEARMNQKRAKYGDAYSVYMRELKRLGVVTLDNKTGYFREDIAITGIDLDEPYYRKFKSAPMTAETIKELAGEAERQRFCILLCHSPLYFDACREWGADLTLSGHFHGGTIRLPVLGGVMTPQFQFFLPWCAGEFKKEEKTMIVSRGLGTHSINIRINNKPQLVVIELNPCSGK